MSILLMLAAQAAPLAIDPDHVRRSALVDCSAKWPDNFSLQGGCRRNYEDGAESVREVARQFASVPAMQRALARCLVKWRTGQTINYSLAGGCARNQADGYSEMAR